MFCKLVHKKQRGFTLIELSFSLVFISILSIAVVFVIISTIKTYSRGVLLGRVNTAGMDLVDDMRAAVQNSSADDLESRCESVYGSSTSNVSKCKNDGGQRFVAISRKAAVKIGDRDIGEVPVFGAFCTGEYSYIWNSGYFMAENDYAVQGIGQATLSYRIEENGEVRNLSNSSFRLLKVHDEDRSVCVSAVDGDYARMDIGNDFSIADDKFRVLDSNPVDILATDDNNNLVLYNLFTARPASDEDGKVLLYAVSFVLGSIQGGVNINASNNFCATTGDEAENLDFCSVNKFNFVALATGRVK